MRYLLKALILYLLILSCGVLVTMVNIYRKPPENPEDIHQVEWQLKVKTALKKKEEVQAIYLEKQIKEYRKKHWPRLLPWTKHPELDKMKSDLASHEQKIEELSKTIQKLEDRRDVLAAEHADDSWITAAAKSLGKSALQGLKKWWHKALLMTTALLIFLPAYKTFLYYLLAPWLERRKAIRIFGDAQPHAEDSSFITDLGSGKLKSITLQPGRKLVVKDEAYTAGYTDSSDSELQKSTEWFFRNDIRTIILSFSHGLIMMNRYENPPTATHAQEVQISSEDPDEYFSEIRISDGQQFYIAPSALVAYTDGIRLSACWRLFSLTAWCAGQIRYYSISGNGQIIVSAHGGATGKEVTPEKEGICKKHSVTAATQGVRMHVRRTETFFPYLLGKTSLFDLRLDGRGCYLLRNAIGKHATPVERMMYICMKALGKFLGF